MIVVNWAGQGVCYIEEDAEDVSPSVNLLVWWDADDLPYWSKACSDVLLIQPSSAVAERLFFSILTNSFSDRQNHSLQDYIETSMMMQFNS